MSTRGGGRGGRRAAGSKSQKAGPRLRASHRPRPGPRAGAGPRLRASPLPCRPTKWSGKRDSNPRLLAWEASALPLSYSRLNSVFIILPAEPSGQAESASPAPPRAPTPREPRAAYSTTQHAVLSRRPPSGTMEPLGRSITMLEMPKERFTRRVLLVCLVLLCAGAFALRYNQATTHNPHFDPASDDGLYWTEAAFHYRLAEKVASGEGIGQLDVDAQYPEGLAVFRQLTPVMEIASGTAYRLLGRPGPFHVFLIRWVCALNSALVVLVFFLVRELWEDDRAALACALLYALSAGAYGRAVQSFIREDWAMPFLVGAMLAYIVAAKRGSRGAALAIVPLTAIGVASWHMGSLVMLAFLLPLAIEIARAQEPGRFRLPTLCLVGGAVLAAVISPALRTKGALISPPLLLGYALVGLGELRALTSMRRGRAALAAGAGLIVLLAASALGGRGGEYSHVWALVAAKLRYLTGPPADPGRIPFEARIMWQACFLSPGLRNFVLQLSTLLPVGLGGAIVCLGRSGRKPLGWDGRVVVLLAVGSAILYALMNRLVIAAALFLAVLSGAAFVYFWRRPRVAVSVLILALAIEGLRLTKTDVLHPRPDPQLTAELYEFLRGRTPADAVILANMGLSPTILAYADRPIAVHSKFESALLRDKVRAFYEALYDKPEAMLDLCRAWDVAYVVYEPRLLFSPEVGSPRYCADELGPADRDWLAYRMNFEPEGLASFGLVMQNADYRVFAVGGEFDPGATVPIGDVYEPALFEGADDRMLTEALRSAMNAAGNPHAWLGVAGGYLEAGKLDLAEDAYWRAIALNDGLSAAFLQLGVIAARRGDAEAADLFAQGIAWAEKEVGLRELPGMTGDAMRFVRDNDALIRERTEKAREAAQLWQKSVGQARSGSDEQALYLAQQATAVFPPLIRAWRVPALIYIQQRRFHEAADAYERVLAVSRHDVEARSNMHALRAAREGQKVGFSM